MSKNKAEQDVLNTIEKLKDACIRQVYASAGKNHLASLTMSLYVTMNWLSVGMGKITKLRRLNSSAHVEARLQKDYRLREVDLLRITKQFASITPLVEINEKIQHIEKELKEAIL